MIPRPGVRVCLLTGGGYPYRRDALGGWCRTLVDGLGPVEFNLVTVTEREPSGPPVYPLSRNVASVRALVLHRAGRPERRRGPAADAATEAAVQLCRGLLGDPEKAATTGGAGLRTLAGLCGPAPERTGGADRSRRFGLIGHGHLLAGNRRVEPVTTDPLAGVPLTDVLQDAWRAGLAGDSGDRLPLPRLSVRDARAAATLLRQAMRALAVRPPETDLVHCVGGTTPLLAALAGHWAAGTPLLLTEARAAVARARPAEDRLSPAVRTVLRRFRRVVARIGYAEAGLIAPLSGYHHEWALRHGARPGRLVSVPAGVDPLDYATDPEPETAAPALVWAGSGGPDSGLTPLLEAFGTVATLVPGTVLHLVGVTAAHEDHCAEQIERSGLGRAVRLHPLPADPRDRYMAGHVVVHVPGPADPPYRLIEAMMSGRAVVGMDVGAAAETIGDAGVLVPAGDPGALAQACVSLLRDPARRRSLGAAARRRALARFTTDRVVRVYGELYADLARPVEPVPSYELRLAVPAPRSALPATVRWLTGAPPARAAEVDLPLAAAVREDA